MSYNIKLVDKAEEKGKVILKGAYLYYSKHTEYGAPVYDAVQDKSLLSKEKPWMYREYAVDILVTKQVGKALKKVAKKLSVREIDADSFEDTFKTKPPFEAEEYYIVKATKMAYYKNTEEASPPITVVGKTRDEDLKETEFGNGSQGNVILKTRSWTYGNTKGVSLDLSTIQVLDLIPYEGGGSDLDDLDFEDDDLDDDLDDMEDDDGVPFEEDEEDEDWD